MKKALFTIVLASLSFLLNAQNHHYTETFAFVSKEAGRSVQKPIDNLQVSVSTISSSSFRVKIFNGNSRTSTYDFKYKYDSVDRGTYAYKCINCGSGEQSYILSKHQLSHFANGEKGSIMLFITDYMGDYEMTIDLNY